MKSVESEPTFRTTMSPPSSRSKNKPRKTPAWSRQRAALFAYQNITLERVTLIGALDNQIEFYEELLAIERMRIYSLEYRPKCLSEAQFLWSICRVIRNDTDVLKQQPVPTYWGVKIKLEIFLNLDIKKIRMIYGRRQNFFRGGKANFPGERQPKNLLINLRWGRLRIFSSDRPGVFRIEQDFLTVSIFIIVSYISFIS
jgi:hypothetical protein